MKDEYILSRIKNLEQSLQWQEESLEQSRLALVERASECTAEQIAHGWLESDINQIGSEVEEVKSLRDQIKLLECLLKDVEYLTLSGELLEGIQEAQPPTPASGQ